MSGFTPEQQRAVLSTGNILVQAGAGAGKTRTLVERCVTWLLASPDRSLEQILMVTFTEAAATEMRHRIRQQLVAELERHPDNPHPAEQLALLETAHISTLHSFCLHLVRQHFYELDLDPHVTVLPEEESSLLAQEVLDAVLHQHYAGSELSSGDVLHLIEVQCRGNDDTVRSLILRVHHYTQTQADPAGWFQQQERMFASEEPSAWVSWLHDFLQDWQARWLPDLQPFLANAGVSAAALALEELRAPLNPDRTGQILQSIVAAGDKSNKTFWPHGSIGKFRKPIEDFFAEAEFLQALLDTSPHPDDGAHAARSGLRQDWAWCRKPMAALLALTREFGDRYQGAKRELGAVDFHDLEQLALRLLWEGTPRRPTALAEEWRNRLSQIFVDEYQDINAAQDAILTAVGREGAEANRFLVGDVKQSIYRFRLADPAIFQRYAAHWSGGGPGTVIPLQDNFRSHEAILDFVNPFFAGLMRPEVGGVSFGPEAQLQFGDRAGRHPLTRSGDVGRHGTASPPPRVELHLCLTGGGRETQSESDDDCAGSGLAELETTEREARIVGLRLLEMKRTGHCIWDAGLKQHRPVEWQDMVILLRSRRHKVESFAKEFTRLGIPLTATRGGFLESTEIMDLLNLLALLDNPLQDIPAIAVLRSPLVGLTLDELAQVRLAADGSFWAALTRFQHENSRHPEEPEASRERPDDAKSGGTNATGVIPREPGTKETRQKIERFLTQFQRWRRMVRQSSLSRCLETILDETNYLAWASLQPRAAQRQANLRKLIAWAHQFDQFHRQGLFRFLRFIDAQRAAEFDHEPAPTESGNSVRLLTIHQSKGLEFPVVVVADLGKPFNLSDLNGDVILDDTYGLCPRIAPPNSGQRYPSLAHWLANQNQRRQALGEEMRILYVALTRACDTLMLVGTASRKSAAEKWPARARLATRDIIKATSYLDWLGPWLTSSPGAIDLANTPSGSTDLLQWTIYDEADRRMAEMPVLEPLDGPVASALQDPLMVDRIRARIEWTYPHLAATTEPAKTSVSAFRRRLREETGDEAFPVFVPRPGRSGARRESMLSAAEIGTAHHLFLQFASLEALANPTALESEADRVTGLGVLTREQRGTLDLPAIMAFWQSEVGARILEQRAFIHREMPFTFRIPPSDLAHSLREEKDAERPPNPPESPNPPPLIPHLTGSPPTDEDEFIVVQGIVDLAVLLPGEIWILDFKTDAVSRSDCAAKAGEHAPQLQLYALALNRIYRRPVTACWLHFLAANATIPLPLR